RRPDPGGHPAAQAPTGVPAGRVPFGRHARRGRRRHRRDPGRRRARCHRDRRGLRDRRGGLVASRAVLAPHGGAPLHHAPHHGVVRPGSPLHQAAGPEERRMSKMTILRVKGPNADADLDTDDLDYVALGLPPNSGSYTVASPENGDFAFVVTDLLGEEKARVTWEHDAAQTAAQSAEAIAAAINTAIANHEPIENYIERTVYPGSGDLFYAQKKQRSPFLVALVAPGSATLTAF